MKKIIFSIFGILTALTSFAQNILTTGGAENISSIGTDYIQGWYQKSGGNISLYTGGGDYAIGSNSVKHALNVATASHYGLPALTHGVTYNAKVKIRRDSGSGGKALNIYYKEGVDVSVVSPVFTITPNKYKADADLGWKTVGVTFEAVVGTADQFLQFKIGGSSSSTSAVYFDDVTLTILGCNEESISFLENTTSSVGIYDSDVNNGNAINIGVTENVSEVQFYEADGITAADSKFTLEANGTITAGAGAVEGDYKISYKLTSTSDIDNSGENDYDSIIQTFSIIGQTKISNAMSKLDEGVDCIGEGLEAKESITGPIPELTNSITYTYTVTDTEPAKFYNLRLSVNNLIPDEDLTQESDLINIESGTNFTIVGSGKGTTETSVFGASCVPTSGNKVIWAAIQYTGDYTDGEEYTAVFNTYSYSGLTNNEVTLKIIVDNNVAGLETLTKFNFSYGPNPSKDSIKLTAASDIDTVVILNQLGQPLIQTTTNTNLIDISSLTPGIYLMNVSIQGSTGTYKIIKE
jgi:hypothetical protein